jgi:hypothetical protein
LNEIQARLSRLVYAKRSRSADPKARAEEMRALRKERSTLELELARKAGRGDDASEVSFSDLRESIPEQAAIVDFTVHRLYVPAEFGPQQERIRPGRWTAPRVSAWIATPDRSAPAHVDLGPAAELQEAVRSFLESLETRRGIAVVDDDGRTEAQRTNDRLRELLWDPIAPRLADASIVFVSPDTFLGTLPLEILQFEDGRYLLEQLAFVYFQDVTALHRIAKSSPGDGTPTSASGLLVVGGVDYLRRDGLAWQGPEPDEAPEDDRVARVEAGDTPGGGAVARGSEEESLRSFTGFWESLGSTVGESQAIADLHEMIYEDRESRLLLQKSAATEERLKYEIPRHRVVHIATHGFFQPGGAGSTWDRAREERGARTGPPDEKARVTGALPGLLSGIVCAGANRTPDGDREEGFLTAEEVAWLDLSGVEMIVLSACETGLGSQRGGEGMLGLRRALRQAGARTVVTSLWSVPDESTSELMKMFYYRLWLDGESTLDALRGAQLDLLDRNRAENEGRGLPYTWGAFVLEGDWR